MHTDTNTADWIKIPAADWAKGDKSEDGFFRAIVQALWKRRSGNKAFVLGLTGSVAAGKSTFSKALRSALEQLSSFQTMSVVSTDSFLLPNRVLEERGIMHRKGFPESYDRERLSAFLADVRAGRQTSIPLYSHDRYDILPGEEIPFEPSTFLLLEGVGVGPHLEELDWFLYLDAEEEELLRWFLARSFGLREMARNRPESFFHQFRDMPDEEYEARARHIWESINLVNLRENIRPYRNQADVVFHKGANHQVSEVWLPTPDSPVLASPR